MEPDDTIVKEITQSVLKNFVTPLARDQQVVQDACEEWAIDLYGYIKNMQEICKTK